MPTLVITACRAPTTRFILMPSAPVGSAISTTAPPSAPPNWPLAGGALRGGASGAPPPGGRTCIVCPTPFMSARMQAVPEAVASVMLCKPPSFFPESPFVEFHVHLQAQHSVRAGLLGLVVRSFAMAIDLALSDSCVFLIAHFCTSAASWAFSPAPT